AHLRGHPKSHFYCSSKVCSLGDNRLKMDQESCRFVEGVWMHNAFRDEAIRSAIAYKPRDEDVFVLTYPKCGTNWTVFIVYNILSRGEQLSNVGGV
ncbi:hypothetical protein MTO96_051080, partial [Rhipicephalus appendiculatus]